MEKKTPFLYSDFEKSLFSNVNDLVCNKIIVYIFKYSSFLHRGSDGGRELWVLGVWIMDSADS